MTPSQRGDLDFPFPDSGAGEFLRSMDLVRSLPAGIYTCDREGYIESFNAAAVELWGREPVIGEDRWCGAMLIFRTDGTLMPLDECPMAKVIQEHRPIRGEEIIIERPDGTRRHVLPHPQPILDLMGRVTGAVNLLVDITGRRQIEEDRELAGRIPLENPSPVVRLKDGRFVIFANPAAEELMAGWGIGLGDEAPAEVTDLSLAALEAGGKASAELTCGDRIYRINLVAAVEAHYVNLYFNEITDLRAAEDALRVKDAQFRALALNSPVAIFTKDLEGRYTLANPIVCEVLGRTEGVEGLTDYDLLPEEMADTIRGHDLEVIQDGKAREWEENAGSRFFLATKFPWIDAHGNPAGVCGVAVDITDRARMERLLRESEEKFRALANHAPVGIFLSSAEGEALFVNGSWCEMAGMGGAAALGQGWTCALHPEDRERVLGDWNEALREHASSASEFRFLRSDGSVRWIEGSAFQIFDAKGQPDGYIGSCVDITRRKMTEENLSRMTLESDRKRRLYEGLLSNIADLAYVFDLDHRFTYANRALLNIWGKTWDEAIGKNCLELGYPEWHAEMHDREIEEVTSTRKSVRGEVPFLGSEGLRNYEYILSPIFGADGEVEAVAGTTRDVTNRKLGEERAGFLSDLTGRLAPLTAEAEILATALESVGERLGGHRCYFIECHPADNLLSVRECWVRDGAKKITGNFTLGDFGGMDWWNRFSNGDFWVEDVETHPLTRDRAASYVREGIVSYAVQPARAEGRKTVVLAVTDDVPRHWTPDDLSLIEHVIARVWPLVERVRSESALRESRERLRRISDSVPALISYLDRDEVFQFANGRYHEWFGIEPEGSRLRDVLGENFYQQRVPYIRRVLQGETLFFESSTHHRELGPRDVQLSYVPDFDPRGMVRGFYVMGHDVSERKCTEKLLERQARRLRLLWEAAGIILSAENPDAMLQRVFGKISELLEVDTFLNFMVNETGDGLDLVSCHGISPDSREKLARIEFGQAVCGNVAMRREQIVACFIQRSEDPMVSFVKGLGLRAYACNPLIAGGKLLGTLSFASRTRDEFGQEEIEFMETICHYVTGAYARLQLVENLRAADRRKDEFLATLAHELRNPLAPIRTGLEVMKMAGDNPAVIERVRMTMERQVEQLVMLVNDLLDVSRITRGKMRLRTSRVNLADIVRSATEATQPLFLEKSHGLEVILPEVPVELEADPHRLAQVISNLLNNAAKYTDPGGEISLVVTRADDSVRVHVRDNGTGIPSEMLERIFEMFEQVDSPGGGEYGGLGIGLTLVRSLVEMHGGSIHAESEGHGKGSVFSFHLPVRAGDDADSPAEPVHPDSGMPRRKVLLVDDNPAAAETLALAIGLMGHELLVASNGREGLALAEAFLPDLVLMDLGMPVMDGWETARRIRDTGWGKTMKLVALSGWGQDDDRRKTREVGFDHHLVKPAHPEAIRELLRDAGS